MEAMALTKDFWAGKRVMLTGHTGFKGSWLALWLSELGARVTGVGLVPDTTPNLFSQLDLEKRLEQHNIGNICEANAIAQIIRAFKPEVVFHLAAQPLVRRSYRDPLGTWATNVQGSLNILEALKLLENHCAVVMVTTDKVYENQEWDHGYRENDRLGGHDPYSASKAAAELAIASWRYSFCGTSPHQNSHLAIATARAGNVIGGGDWAEDRIMPDAIRALTGGQTVPVRNPSAIRPWQHVLEPLGGYLRLAEALSTNQGNNIQTNDFTEAFNFGPMLEANRSVKELIEDALKYWPGEWSDQSSTEVLHEARRLHLQIDKAHHQLGWTPRWNFQIAVEKTMNWYRSVNKGESAIECCLRDLKSYNLN